MKKLIGFFSQEQKIEDEVSLDLSTCNKFENICCSQEIEICSKTNARIFFVGRIYNIPELQKVFGAEENSPAGCALTAFLHSGIDGIKKIEGSFTIVIQANNYSYIFRDRHGRSLPVFYSDRFFVSDVLDLHGIRNFSVTPDIEKLAKFLHLGYIPSPDTAFEGVKKLAPGNYLRFNEGTLTEGELYPISEYQISENSQMSEEELIAKYEQLHKSAIAKRIEGENEVGVLLSGGFDSGGNICALRDIYDGPIRAFSVGFKGNKWSELPMAELMAKTYDASFQTYEIDGSEIKYLPEMVRAFGDPFHEGGMLVNYAVMKMVSENNLDVALGGDGNDQLFGTGGKELAMHYSIGKLGHIAQKTFDMVSAIPPAEKDNMLFRIRFHNNRILNILQVDNFGFGARDIRKLFQQSINTKGIYHKVEHQSGKFEELYKSKNYHIDIKQTVNEVILNKASRASFIFDNHLAFPYLDNSIYEFLTSLPYHSKTKGSIRDLAKGKGVAKYLLKAYVSPKLPPEIVNKKKQGGFAPLPLFLEDPKQFEEVSNTILDSEMCKYLLSQQEITRLLSSYKQLSQSNGYWFWYKQTQASKIFNLLVLAIWWEIFISKSRKIDPTKTAPEHIS